MYHHTRFHHRNCTDQHNITFNYPLYKMVTLGLVKNNRYQCRGVHSNHLGNPSVSQRRGLIGLGKSGRRSTWANMASIWLCVVWGCACCAWTFSRKRSTADSIASSSVKPMRPARRTIFPTTSGLAICSAMVETLWGIRWKQCIWQFRWNQGSWGDFLNLWRNHFPKFTRKIPRNKSPLRVINPLGCLWCSYQVRLIFGKTSTPMLKPICRCAVCFSVSFASPYTSLVPKFVRYRWIRKYEKNLLGLKSPCSLF
jgi:hypothetical protein